MRTPFLVAVLAGSAIVAALVFGIWHQTKGAHLELTGNILKLRLGPLDEANTAVVAEMRLENPSDMPWVVRLVEMSVQDAKGEWVDGNLIAKSDYAMLFQGSRFLGVRYNEGLSMRDKITGKAKVDRMVAFSFPVALKDMQAGRLVRIHIQDLDGPETTLTKLIE